MKSTVGAEGARAVHCYPAAGTYFADRAVPFNIAQAIVDASLREPLAESAADNGDFRPRGEFLCSPFQPSRSEFAIAVHELNKRCGWRLAKELLEACIPRAGGSKRKRWI